MQGWSTSCCTSMMYSPMEAKEQPASFVPDGVGGAHPRSKMALVPKANTPSLQKESMHK